MSEWYEMLNEKSQTRMALGSDVTLTLISARTDDQLEDVLRACWLHIYEFEKRFSRFLPQSELSRFNRSAGMKQHVSSSFLDLLESTKKLAIETNGLCNPFILPKLQKVGYIRSFAEGYQGDEHDNFSKRSMADIRSLDISGTTAFIPYGTALDFGGFGKGYLADELRSMLPAWVDGHYISTGGDIVVGGTDRFGDNWSIAVQDADDLSATLPVAINLRKQDFAVASSGTLVRKGIHNGKAWHHIIDPRTGDAAQSDMLIATVIADDAMTADVLAKCAVILGSKEAWPYLRRRGAIGAVFQTSQNGVNKVLTHGKGYEWPLRTREVAHA